MARMPRSTNARTAASGPPRFAPPNTLNRNDISPPESLIPLVFPFYSKERMSSSVGVVNGRTQRGNVGNFPFPADPTTFDAMAAGSGVAPLLSGRDFARMAHARWGQGKPERGDRTVRRARGESAREHRSFKVGSGRRSLFPTAHRGLA